MRLEIDKARFERQLEVLQAASTMNGELGKRLRESVFQELKNVRNRIANDIKFDNGDPRRTAQSVKRYVAGKYLGGVVSITNGKSTGLTNSYEAPRKVYPGMRGKRGGNRMIRSNRTNDILHTADRAFILRWINAGTHPRYANGRNGKWGRRENKTFAKLQERGDYFRGHIAPRNFMELYGNPAMQTAVSNLQTIIDEEYSKIFG